MSPLNIETGTNAGKRKRWQRKLLLFVLLTVLPWALYLLGCTELPQIAYTATPQTEDVGPEPPVADFVLRWTIPF